jgi:hypothetical protein
MNDDDEGDISSFRKSIQRRQLIDVCPLGAYITFSPY